MPIAKAEQQRRIVHRERFGDLLMDTDNGKQYICTESSGSTITWVKAGTQTLAPATARSARFRTFERALSCLSAIGTGSASGDGC